MRYYLTKFLALLILAMKFIRLYSYKPCRDVARKVSTIRVYVLVQQRQIFKSVPTNLKPVFSQKNIKRWQSMCESKLFLQRKVTQTSTFI